MRIFAERRIDSRLAAVHKRVSTNGESAIMPSAVVLSFNRCYINKAKPLNSEFRLLKVRFEM